MLRVELTAQDVQVDTALIKAVKKAAGAAVRTEGRRGRMRVSLLVTDDVHIRQLNAQFRHKDTATDVLSFPSDGGSFLGDIAISLPRAQAQAAEYGHSLEREMAFLAAHAMLHLMGYDHENEQDERRMRARQREIMDKAGYTV